MIKRMSPDERERCFGIIRAVCDLLAERFPDVNSNEITNALAYVLLASAKGDDRSEYEAVIEVINRFTIYAERIGCIEKAPGGLQ